MKKTKNLLRFLTATLFTACIAAVMSFAVLASVCSSHYVSVKGGNVNVGDVITLRESAYLQDLENGSDYGVQNAYSYSVSDSSIAKVSGNKLTFLKAGSVTLNIKHTQTFEKTNKTSTHTDTVDFTVKIDSSVPSGNGEKVYVGQTVSLPVGPKNDYEPAYNNYTFSEEGFAESIGNGRITFLKPGTLTVSNSWKLWDGENPKPRTGTITKTYDIYIPEEIPATTIKLTSDPFIGGGIFPDFKIAGSGDYSFRSATFYHEMCDYYIGDRLPYFREGTKINYIDITIKPDKGYIFSFDGEADGKSHPTTKYKVEYNGKTYDANVVHSYGKNELSCYIDATVAVGTVYHTTISDLEPPYHMSELDKEITTHSDVEAVSVKYTMFNKELTDFKNGDNIGIVVRLKTNGKNKFLKDSKVYWKEQQVYSDITTLISEKEAEFVFTYKVTAKDEQTIRWADFTIPGVYVGEALPEIAFPATEGVTVKSVTWTPNDEKVDANKEYTVKIQFEKKAEFIYASDFAEQGVVRINGERAKFVDETTTKGKFSNIKYFAEATFKPQAAVNLDTGSDNVVVNNGTTGATTGTIVGTATITPAPEFIINIKYNENDITAEQGEKVILDFTHDMDLMLCSNIRYQWYEATSNIYGTGTIIEGADKKQYQAYTLKPGTSYYYCVMKCNFDGEEYSSVSSDAAIVKVTTTESSAEGFTAKAVTETNIITKDGSYTLKVEPVGNGKKDVSYSWLKCDKDGKVNFDSFDYALGNSKTGDTLTAFINPTLANQPQYVKAVVTCLDRSAEIIFTITYVPEVKDVEDEEIPEEKFELSAFGLQDITVYSSETKITFKAEVTGTDKLADFQWYRCDKDGNSIGAPLSMGDTVTVGPIPEEDMLVPYYYRCTAMIGNTAKSVIFKAILAPMGVEEEYVFPFTDVKESDWFYNSVRGAHEMGLINGKTETTYCPDDNMTYAEAVKLAVCMNIISKGGNPKTDIANGTDVWYSTYMTYALDNGIIDDDYSSVANERITRKQYVYIFSKALPTEQLEAKNEIPDGSIPDVTGTKLAQDKAVYTFYRAGILSGVDSKGTFKPDDNIKRSEVAAILIRMMDASTRVNAPADLAK